MYPPDLIRDAELLLRDFRARNLRLVTAESCTGGLVAAILTEIPGASDVVERAFVTYSNDAKAEAIGVPVDLIKTHGAVSAEVARAMAVGALGHSHADIAVSTTGIAGPGGGTAEKPVGLVHFAAATQAGKLIPSVRRFGDIGRGAVRLASVREAFSLLRQALDLN
jgi:nicotinamide-nucleotide amidase